MKIAIDISPLSTGHKVRGVGFYLEYLKKSLLTNFPENEYEFFTDINTLNKKIDLVHYPYFDPYFLTLPLKKKYKTVVTVHDLTPIVFPEHFPAGIKGGFRWQLQKYNLKKVDAVIADSYASKHDIVRLVGIPDEKVFVAHLAAADEFKRSSNKSEEKLREKYNLPEKFALYVGDVTWNKNVPRLVQAAIEAEVTLVMVGKTLVATEFDRNNPWNKDLIEVQTLAKNHPNIIRLGFVSTEDLVFLYNRATVFVFPSIYEGFGLPVVEAMQSGCPVITTKGGSLQEVAGDAAYFVDESSIKSIAQGIQKVMHSKKQQEELSQKGFQQAKKFSWAKTAEQTLAVYKYVLGK